MSKQNKYSILVVDDEASNIFVLTEILKNEYTIYSTEDSTKAQEMAEEKLPHMILLDIRMPRMDGYEVLTELKKSKKTSNIPVILVTGVGSTDAEEKGLELGAVDYIIKPFRASIVRLRIRNQFKLVEQIHQHALMSQITHSFLSDAYVDSLITKTLKVVGEFMNAALLLLYEINDGVLLCRNEWKDPELKMKSRIGEKHVLGEEMLGTIKTMMTNNESNLCLHSNDPVFKEVSKPYRKNFHSFITAPIFIKGNLCAVIDISREDDGREWDESDIHLAVLFADVLSGVFERDVMERQYSIVENSPSIILSIDPNAVVEYVNPAASETTGYSRSEFFNKGLATIFSGDTLNAMKTKHIPAVMSGEKVQFETGIYLKDGKYCVYIVSAFKTGKDSITVVLRDVTKMRRLEIENKKLFVDGLTDIYNRRFFDETIERMIKSLSRAGSMMTLMMVDIDFFKHFNDTYGHSAGDDCLRYIAETLNRSLPRADDFIARYGGEEFVIVLPNTDEDGAHLVAERMLDSIRGCNIPHENSAVAEYVTISIGVATSDVKHTHSADDFVGLADKMLYLSKQNGRNQYNISGL